MQGAFPQPSTSYSANRPAFNPVYPHGIHRPATPPGIPGGEQPATLLLALLSTYTSHKHNYTGLEV